MTNKIKLPKKRIGFNLQDVVSWDVELLLMEIKELSVRTVVEVTVVIDDLIN